MKEKRLERVFPVPSAVVLWSWQAASGWNQTPGQGGLPSVDLAPTGLWEDGLLPLNLRARDGTSFQFLPVPGYPESFALFLNKPCPHFAHGPSFILLRGLAGSHLPGSLAPKTSLSTQLTLNIPRLFLSLWREFLLFFYPTDQFSR